jgi:hypothetical protein
MALWRFADYCSPAGNNLIQEWYEDLPEEAQAEFDVTLKALSIAEDWRGRKEFKHLGRKGLGEIRFSSLGVQYRPAGCFEGQKRFAIYIGCFKKGNVYNPPDAFELALKNRARVLRGEASLRDRII